MSVYATADEKSWYAVRRRIRGVNARWAHGMVACLANLSGGGVKGMQFHDVMLGSGSRPLQPSSFNMTTVISRSSAWGPIQSLNLPSGTYNISSIQKIATTVSTSCTAFGLVGYGTSATTARTGGVYNLGNSGESAVLSYSDTGGVNTGISATMTDSVPTTVVTSAFSTDLKQTSVYAAAARYMNGVGIDCFVSGALVASTANTNNLQFAPSGVRVTGQIGQITPPIMAGWFYPLSDAQIQALSNDPFQLFTLAPKYWMMTAPAAVAGGFKPYWASQRSRVIHAGVI